MRDWTFGERIAMGFGISALTLAAVAIVGYQSAGGLISASEQVAHSYQVRHHIALLASTLTDLETGVRGYVVTAEPEFLEPYLTALGRMDDVQAQLSALTRDNASHQADLIDIKAYVKERLLSLQKNRATVEQEGFEAARKLMLKGEGKEIMDKLRILLDRMDRREEELQAVRNREADQSARLTRTSILAGSLAGFIIIIIAGWVVTRALSSKIGLAVHSIQSASTELQAAANQQASASREQSVAMAQITTTVTELLASSRQIAESAQRVAQAARQSAHHAHAGDAMVGQAQASVVVMQQQVERVVAQMLELGRGSQEMGGILDMVAELAEQTNILAINATIEAAGAGEAGRRFGVVADEIRKLADRTSASTQEIRGLIDGMRGAVNTTIMATEASAKAVENGAKTFTAVTGAFREITQQVTTTTEVAREIELSTQQQTTAVEQVNVATHNVALSAKETTMGADQTFRTASELAKLSGALTRIIQSSSKDV